MCFSPEASFGLAAVLVPAGIYCVHRAIHRNLSYLPLALLPAVFGVQQIAEGLVWVGINRFDRRLVVASSLTFLFFALCFWLFWIPFCLLLIEQRRPAKWFLGVVMLLGLAGGLTLYLPLLLNHDIVSAGLKRLKGFDFKQLTKLNLFGTNVTDAGLKELKDYKQLTTLDLSETKVTDAGLTELKDFKQITTLYLSGTKVTDTGLKELKDFKQMADLSLINTKVTDAGLKELKGLKQLKLLKLNFTKVTDAGVDDLKKELPECFISR